MSEALVVLNQTDLQRGGLGIDFSSKLFQLKPATVNINQRMTQAEGAIPGKLRISETGDQFDFMRVVLLALPKEQRQFYVGEPGQMKRTQENLYCFSRDCVKPDPSAKEPQALSCGSCNKASWEPWREKLNATGQRDPKLIPPCEKYYYALMLDTVTQMPLQMFIRSTSKEPFETGMQNLIRKLTLLKAQGRNPNIFDVSFSLGAEPSKKNKTIFVPRMFDFKAVDDAERASFGEAFLSFTNRNRVTTEQAALEEAAAESQTIDAEVVEAGTAQNVVQGEIII